MARDLTVLPKTDLHVHLEGSARPSTVRELAARAGVGSGPAGLWGRARSGAYADFLRMYQLVDELLTGPDVLTRLAVELCEDEAREGVRYAEVTFTLAPKARKLRSWAAPLDAVLRGFREGRARFGIECALILDVLREDPETTAGRVIEEAVARRGDGVVGVGLSGDERLPVRPAVRRLLRAAADAGLAFVPHAGESSGPRPIVEILDFAVPTRIGHGIGAAESPALLGALEQMGVGLEICLSSNLATGAVPSLARHPFPRLAATPIPLTLASDDPGLFGSTLCGDYRLARDAFGCDDGELASLARAGVAMSCAEERLKDEIRRGVDSWLGSGAR